MSMSHVELLESIKSSLQLETVPQMIIRQIRKFRRENALDNKEIARAVYYFYVVQGRLDYDDLDKYGIGIVPSVADKANKYFIAMKKQKDIRQNKANMAKVKLEKIETLVYKPYKKPSHRKEIKIDEL